jgi:Putative polyhydroxyalkanoic acid system protein (PHA_gran_rgn)
MSRPLIVSIPHNLGREEALRRLKGGMGNLRTQFGDKLTRLEDTWTGDRMDFNLAALGQSVSGHLVVFEDTVRVEVQLPWLLSMIVNKVRPFIEKQGQLMLEKK